jgi:hypothetical protein
MYAHVSLLVFADFKRLRRAWRDCGSNDESAAVEQSRKYLNQMGLYASDYLC